VRAYSESAPADITVFVQDTSLFVQNVWKVDPEVEEIGAIVAEVSLKTKFIELEVEVIDKSVEGQVIETPEVRTATSPYIPSPFLMSRASSSSIVSGEDDPYMVALFNDRLARERNRQAIRELGFHIYNVFSVLPEFIFILLKCVLGYLSLFYHYYVIFSIFIFFLGMYMYVYYPAVLYKTLAFIYLFHNDHNHIGLEM